MRRDATHRVMGDRGQPRQPSVEYIVVFVRRVVPGGHGLVGRETVVLLEPTREGLVGYGNGVDETSRIANGGDAFDDSGDLYRNEIK